MYRSRFVWKGLFSLLLALIWVAASIIPAFADIYTPPVPPDGAGIMPENEQTRVRMMYENVFMDIGVDGVAKVDANFVMRNLGDKEERMDVYFPLFAAGYSLSNPGEDCGQDTEGKSISDLAVWVWDKPQPVRTDWRAIALKHPIPSPDPNAKKIPCWGVFAALFPPGIDVPIEVKYTSPSYAYILRTGASWNGTIGQADITFRLPYESIRGQNMTGCYPDTCILNGRDIQWQFMDFEPATDLKIKIAPPNAWWRVLIETNNLKLNPNDRAALKRLAIAYGDSIQTVVGSYFSSYPSGYYGYALDTANQWRYRMATEMFRKAIALNPDDFDLHYQFANLVCIKAEWPQWLADYPTDSKKPDDMTPGEQRAAQVADWVECAQHLQQALEIDPKSEGPVNLARYLIEHYESVRYINSNAYIQAIVMNETHPNFLILTPTLTWAPTPTITLTPDPSELREGERRSAFKATLTPRVAILLTPTIQQTRPTDTVTPMASPSTPAQLASETGSGTVWVWMLIPLVAILALVVLRKRTR